MQSQNSQGSTDHLSKVQCDGPIWPHESKELNMFHAQITPKHASGRYGFHQGRSSMPTGNLMTIPTGKTTPIMPTISTINNPQANPSQAPNIQEQTNPESPESWANPQHPQKQTPIVPINSKQTLTKSRSISKRTLHSFWSHSNHHQTLTKPKPNPPRPPSKC